MEFWTISREWSNVFFHLDAMVSHYPTDGQAVIACQETRAEEEEEQKTTAGKDNVNNVGMKITPRSALRMF